MSETALQTAFLKAMAQMGVWAIRLNSGMRGKVRMAPAGTPDICLPALGWMELKVPGGVLSPAQRAWHERARKEGVWVATAWSLEEAIRLVRERQREVEALRPVSDEWPFPMLSPG